MVQLDGMFYHDVAPSSCLSLPHPSYPSDSTSSARLDGANDCRHEASFLSRAGPGTQDQLATGAENLGCSLRGMHGTPTAGREKRQRKLSGREIYGETYGMAGKGLGFGLNGVYQQQL